MLLRVIQVAPDLADARTGAAAAAMLDFGCGAGQCAAALRGNAGVGISPQGWAGRRGL